MNVDGARIRVLLSNRRVCERSISVEGHAIVLAWLMLLGPAVVGPSAKHSPEPQSRILA